MIFTAATVDNDIPVNNTHTLEVTLQQNGQPVPNAQISFNSTRGTLTTDGTTPLTGPVLTNAQGAATVVVESASAGIATLTTTAVSNGTTATTQIEFVSSDPQKINMQASPSVIGANIDASGTKSSQIIAVVRDNDDNPVNGVRVDFSSIADPSNG